MRISDWSSDVCSSDLGACPFDPRRQCAADRHAIWPYLPHGRLEARRRASARRAIHGRRADRDRRRRRSEEHTSELQSLMRISYAVFCLKKKKNNNRTTQLPSTHKTTQHIKKYSANIHTT